MLELVNDLLTGKSNLTLFNFTLILVKKETITDNKLSTFYKIGHRTARVTFPELNTRIQRP